MKTNKRKRRMAAALTAPIRAGRKDVWGSPAEPKSTWAHLFNNDKTKWKGFSNDTYEDWRLHETLPHDCRRHIPQWHHHQVTVGDSSVYLFPPPPRPSVRSYTPGKPDWWRHLHTCKGAEVLFFLILCAWCTRQAITKFSNSPYWLFLRIYHAVCPAVLPAHTQNTHQCVERSQMVFLWFESRNRFHKTHKPFSHEKSWEISMNRAQTLPSLGPCCFKKPSGRWL